MIFLKNIVDNWIRELTNIVNHNLLKVAMIQNKIEFSTDVSFFPEHSEVVSAHIIITYQNRKIRWADFITSIIATLQKLFTAELCRVLAICKLVEYYSRVFHLS